jgi:hypothetical protein
VKYTPCYEILFKSRFQEKKNILILVIIEINVNMH